MKAKYCPQHQSYHTSDVCRAVDQVIRETAVTEYQKAFRPLSTCVTVDKIESSIREYINNPDNRFKGVRAYAEHIYKSICETTTKES